MSQELFRVVASQGKKWPFCLLQGFERVYENMPDLSLDVPAAYNILDRFVTRCRSLGIIDEDLVRKMPTR